MSDDDFEEIHKPGFLKAPCTVKCVRFGRAKARTVSLTFRSALLPEDVNKVLSAPRLSAAYSPSQRVVRVKTDPAGQFQLSRAPRATNVWLLRFPYSDKMPWVDHRIVVEVDANEAQGAIFLDLGPIFDTREGQPALPAPAPASPPPQPLSPGCAQSLPVTEDADGRIFCTGVLAGVVLDTQYRRLLWLLSDGKKHDKPIVLGVMAEHGFTDLSLSAMVGRINKGLAKCGVEVTESTDRRQLWMTPMALAAYRRHAGAEKDRV